MYRMRERIINLNLIPKTDLAIVHFKIRRYCVAVVNLVHKTYHQKGYTRI